MRYIHRILEKELLRASRAFPSLLVTGPRRSGKTTLLKKVFPKATYFLLEDPDIIARIQNDPISFIEEVKPPCIFDEIQNVPVLFNYVRTYIDRAPERAGQWFFTGSQDTPLMKGVSESMAGRVAVFHLLPLSSQEDGDVSIIAGGFPEVLAKPKTASLWFRSYIQTYLERDVRAISAIKDLAAFRRFLSILASRCGCVLNKTDLASPLGVSVPTLSEWLSILEVTGQIIVVPPFYENFGKRLIKSPKVYFTDSGLASYLLGIETDSVLRRSMFFGQLFEGFVASEIIKHQINAGKRRQLYYFRDQQGLEVDFLVPTGDGHLVALEAKAARTVKLSMGASLDKLSRAISRYSVTNYVVHLDPPRITVKEMHNLSSGIKTIPAREIGGVL